MLTRTALQRWGDIGLLLVAVGFESVMSEVPGIPGSWVLVPMMLLLYLPLLVRRRWPLPVLAWVCLVTAAVASLSAVYWPFAGLLIGVFAAGRWARGRLQLLVPVLVAVPVVALALVDEADPGAVLLTWSVFSFLAWAAGWALRRAEQLRVLQRTRLLEAARHRRQQERLTLARELHDNVAGSISAIVVQAAGAKALQGRDDPRAEAALDVITLTGTHAVEQMQRLLNLLRSEDESTDLIITQSETIADLPDLVEEAERRGLQVQLHTAGEPHGITPGVSATTYRVVQESLTNALKHAGAGSTVAIEVQWRPADVEVEVRSTVGPSPAPPLPSTGFGLAGLGERIRLVGGTFSFSQEPDAFVTVARLPLTSVRAGAP